jgi:hypothetical protein
MEIQRLITNEQEYNDAIARYEIVKYAVAGKDHKEKLFLVHLIETYENSIWDLPEIISADFKLTVDNSLSKYANEKFIVEHAEKANRKFNQNKL